MAPFDPSQFERVTAIPSFLFKFYFLEPPFNASQGIGNYVGIY